MDCCELLVIVASHCGLFMGHCGSLWSVDYFLDCCVLLWIVAGCFGLFFVSVSAVKLIMIDMVKIMRGNYNSNFASNAPCFLSRCKTRESFPITKS